MELWGTRKILQPDETLGTRKSRQPNTTVGAGECHGADDTLRKNRDQQANDGKSNPAEKAGLGAIAAVEFLRCRVRFCRGAGVCSFLVLRPHNVDLGICGHRNRTVRSLLSCISCLSVAIPRLSAARSRIMSLSE